jgi:hypothetical protein
MRKPTNHRTKWTDIEEKKLIKELSSGISINDISKEHGRTYAAVNTKIVRIVYNMYLSSKTVDNIRFITNLDEYLIRDIIKRNNATNNYTNMEDLLKILRDTKNINTKLKKIKVLLPQIKEFIVREEVYQDTKIVEQMWEDMNVILAKVKGVKVPPNIAESITKQYKNYCINFSYIMSQTYMLEI